MAPPRDPDEQEAEAVIEELLALDLLTLRAHTEQAGDAWDAERQRQITSASLREGKLCTVRRNGGLVAYACLRPVAEGAWFVSGLNTHPEHRSAPVLMDLFEQLGEVIRQAGARELRSHVYKTNEASIRFHRRLGFEVVRENDKALEFMIAADTLMTRRMGRSRAA